MVFFQGWRTLEQRKKEAFGTTRNLLDDQNGPVWTC
jgi:hypothetical protein